MSKASDVAYGRGGGRFVDGDVRMDVSLDEIHRARLAGVAAGTWPERSIDIWLGLAVEADEHLAAGRPIDTTLDRALEVAAAHRKRTAAA